MIRIDPRAACEKLINLSVTSFPAASDGALAAPGVGSLLATELVSSRGKNLMYFDVVPSKSVPPYAEADDVSATENAAAGLIGNVSSATHTANAFSATGKTDNKPIVVYQAPAISGVPVNSGTATLAKSD